MSQRRAKLLRKGHRVRKREERSEVDQRLAEARAECDQALFEANEAFRKGVDKLAVKRADARKVAQDAYNERRDMIVKVYADEQDEAAA